MNWYQGSITEAVNLSVQKKAIFVVYVEGKDELSKKLTGFINEPGVRTALESEEFIAIRIDGGSEAYMQFASIYKMVPLPSIFFIGKNGTPLEVVTGLIASASELQTKIQNVLTIAKIDAAAASSQLIAAETEAAASSAANAKPPADKSAEMVCEGGVCTLKTVEKPQSTVEEPVVEETPEEAEKRRIEKEKKDAFDARVERTRKLLEEKRKQREKEEEQEKRERELKRRKEGKEMLNLKEWQKEQEFKDVKDSIRKEKIAEQANRQRILEQIAGDRAERAKLLAQQRAPAEPETAPQPKLSTDSTTTKIQFRVPSGEPYTHTFNNSDLFGKLREYVQTQVAPGLKDFTLATTFPRREFTAEHNTQTLLELEMCPSAVVLIIPRASSGPAAAVARTGGLVNIFNTLFWTVLSPVFAVFGYFKKLVVGGGPPPADRTATGPQKRASEEQMSQHDLAKKRNLARFGANEGASTSNSSAADKPAAYRRYGGGSNIHRLADQKDSDDDNATWNGNSTQQQ